LLPLVPGELVLETEEIQVAFGIDDVLMAVATGISLTDTCVRTVKAYRQKGIELDIERLIEEVRVTAL
jgi:hypothetical protein